MKQLLALICTLALSVTAHAGSFPDISLDALKAAIADKSATLIDVNGTASFKDGHIPGAIDFAANQKDMAPKLPADKTALIVAYCGNENCGAYARAAEAAKELGYTNVQHFKPGLAGWKASGGGLEKAE